MQCQSIYGEGTKHAHWTPGAATFRIVDPRIDPITFEIICLLIFSFGPLLLSSRNDSRR